jgi:hypothetical protein
LTPIRACRFLAAPAAGAAEYFIIPVSLPGHTGAAFASPAGKRLAQNQSMLTKSEHAHMTYFYRFLGG